MTTNKPPYLMRCVVCNEINNEHETTTFCVSCGGVLTIDYAKPSEDIQFPINSSCSTKNPFQKYSTTLCHLANLSKKSNCLVYGKLESDLPTGCFKDRGSWIEVLKAKELNKKAIAVASTGNMAASTTLYASYIGLPCYVFVPYNAPPNKLVQAYLYGAKILRIQGDFTVCEALCRKFCQSMDYYNAGDFVFREEGQKTFCYELITQDPSLFDDVLIPIGCGTNFSAIYKGFKELKDAGKLDHIPRLVGLQPLESSPVVEGIIKHKKIVLSKVNTIASAVAIPNPIDFQKVMIAIEKTKGFGLRVSDLEILVALRELALEEGLLVEPSSALGWAALKKYNNRFKGRKVLLVITGHGLKEAAVISNYIMNPPVLNPDIEQVTNFIASGFYQLQEQKWAKSTIKPKELITLDSPHQSMYVSYVDKIQETRKALSKEEIEILKQVINEEPIEPLPVDVIDYSITMSKSSVIKAKIHYAYQDKDYYIEGTGVGAIDTIIKVLKEALHDDFPIDVISHEINVVSAPTDSLVVITLTLFDGVKKWKSRAISTDTLDAAIHAYLKGITIKLEATLAPN